MDRGKSIYLLTSNWTKDYVINMVKVLSLPYGYIMHFNYLLKWLSKDIRDFLQLDEDKSVLQQPIDVVLCYIHQDTENCWDAGYILRKGTLIKAYKTGDTDSDVSYFYFKLSNYINSDNTDEDDKEQLKQISGENWNNYFVFWRVNQGNERISPLVDAKSSFNNARKRIKEEHLKSPEGKLYSPCYCYIDGLTDKDNKAIGFKEIPSTHASYYEIEEGENYYFKFRPYLTTIPSSYKLQLTTDSRVFSTTPLYEIDKYSPYDEGIWMLTTSLLERDIWTSIKFVTNLSCPENRNQAEMEPVNFELEIPVHIKRKLPFRILLLTGEIAFSAAAVIPAIKATLPQESFKMWPYFTFGAFFWWTITRVLRVFRES